MARPVQTFVLFIGGVVLSTSSAYAQLPFYTDEADTTPKRKFHFDFANEHDWLQLSALPGLRQNTSVFTLNYGFTDRIELGVSAPFVMIFNERNSRLGNPAGIGDTRFGIKVKLLKERDTLKRPAVTIVFYAEAPTGSIRKQIGSGFTDLLGLWSAAKISNEANDRTAERWDCFRG